MYLHAVELNSNREVVQVMGIPSSIIESAKAKLLQLLQEKYPELDPDQVILERFNFIQWEDASLGCPDSEHSYAQVLTPGYKLVFRVGNEFFAMHTDASGDHIVSPDFKSDRESDLVSQRG